jgi:hypothetical protein
MEGAMSRLLLRHRAAALVIGVSGVVAQLLVPSAVPQASAQSLDYHVEAFGDPMDFSNPEDLVIDTDEAMFVGGTNKSISGGQLHFDANGAFQFDPVWAGFPTGLPHGREGGRYPIDTGKYRRFVIRMNAPQGAPVGLRWFNCLKQSADCQGGQAWFARGGWNTYEIVLGDDGTVPGLPLNWTGQMLGLRFVGTVVGHFDVDWIRLAPADGTPVGEIVGGPTIDVRPLDKLDYATASGNPWDMDSMGDLKELVALRPGSVIESNTFKGCSLGTNTLQFPGLVFNLPSGPIDASRFKRLTFEYSYPGPFSARPVNGGGAFARVFWFSPDGKRHPTNAIHLYPNENVVSVDLTHPQAMFQGIEPGKGVATGAPWAGLVTGFRINPNDTKDGKCFTMGRVWLTADEPPGVQLTPLSLALRSPSALAAKKQPSKKAKPKAAP